MEEELIFNTLEKWNFWNREINLGKIRTFYLNQIKGFILKREILVLKGIRRCGKSTIMKQMMYELVEKYNIPKKNILYVNLEDYNFISNLNLDLLESILKVYKNRLNPKGKIYFFIDEIQNIENWEKWIRTYYDLEENIKFVVSGSSASLLSKELSTLLTGRNISFKINPFSYKEINEFKKITLNEYLEFGGFPEVVFEKDIEKKKMILEQYFKDIVYKDIIDRYEIRNSKQLFAIATYLISNPRVKISTNKLSKVYGISKETVQLYISYLLDTFLLIEVPYFSYSVKTRHDVSKLPKYFVVDNGIVNVVTVKFSKNLGNLYENSVCIKLKEKYDEIFYFDNGVSEVDFVFSEIGLNVTFGKEIEKREYIGLEDFSKKYKKFKTYLIYDNITKENEININDFLLDKITILK